MGETGAGQLLEWIITVKIIYLSDKYVRLNFDTFVIIAQNA